MSVGERLKQARKLANLSGEKAGELIGVSKSQISNIEKGNSDLTRSNAIVLAERLGVSLNWLLTGEGSMHKDREPERNSTAYSGISQKGKGNTQQVGSGSFTSGGSMEECLQQLAKAQEEAAEWKRKYYTLLDATHGVK